MLLEDLRRRFLHSAYLWTHTIQIAVNLVWNGARKNDTFHMKKWKYYDTGTNKEREEMKNTNDSFKMTSPLPCPANQESFYFISILKYFTFVFLDFTYLYIRALRCIINTIWRK